MSRSTETTGPVEDHPTMEDKILHCLSIYPIISPSMLQIGIGTHHAPTEWRPILRDLVQKGKILELEKDTVTVTGRNFTYTRLMLPGTIHNA